MKIFEKQINGSCVFFTLVVFVYLIIGIFNFNLVMSGLRTTGGLLGKILHILFGINFLINKFLKKEKIAKHLGRDSGKAGLFYAIVSGILISGPPYVLFPLLKDLKRKGMKDSLIAVFLYNRNVKIPFIPVMIYYFGLAFTIIISVYIILFSLLNGFLVDFFLEKQEEQI